MAHTHTNALVNETSPYLLQHAHNPVNWQGWNDEAWKAARMADKPVIVSIGYSACHWCHVMEHESFEDAVVAQIMNEHFISIKVDREERPDVDQIYMDACQLISGRGGWPLNAITLPDGRPLYAGTYFPKENWKQVLLYFVDYWKNHRDEAMERAAQITNGIKAMDTFETPAADNAPQVADRQKLFSKIEAAWDYDKGGRAGAPKFPMPVTLQYLLQHHYYTGNLRSLKALTVTLDNMMNGGLYDQIGGGFARYSVDDRWEIPHFEKMLYDNAQLVSLYANAYCLTGNPRYKQVVYETLDFAERELSDESGGFYSALDADSEGEEGKFYVWGYRELKNILGGHFTRFTQVFEVSEAGNFEGHNHLTRLPGAEASAEELNQWKQLLMAERGKRVRPGLDDKVLTSWNALLLLGYCDAAKAFGDERFLKRALALGNFISNTLMQPDGSIMRNYKKGRVTINGFLDDYSFTAEAFISLYRVTLDESWLGKALKIAQYAEQHFYNAATGLFYYTGINDAPLIARKTETSDNVIPSSNASMAVVFYTLGVYYEDSNYTAIAQKAYGVVAANVHNHPAFYARWASLADWLLNEPYQLAVAGPNAIEVNAQLSKHYLPNCLTMGTATTHTLLPLLQGKYSAGNTMLYICRHKTCGLPLSTVNEVLNEVKRD